MGTREERERRIEALRSFPPQARRAVQGMSDARLDTPYRAGGWTVRQVIHHLADSHMNAFVRMKLILAEDHPTLKPYDQDKWAALPDGREGAVEPSLAILDGVHARMVRLLEDQPDAAWSRTAFHPERGEVTLERILEIYSDHGAHHLRKFAHLSAAR
jgi:DinB family protein